LRKKLMCLALALALLAAGAAAAEPLTLTEDLQEEVRTELNENASYVYAYRYPQVDPTDPSAELINTFFQYKASDAVGFEIPMNADYYRKQNPSEDVRVEIDYEVTFNGEDFFSVLVRMTQGDLKTYTGYTFSRKDLKPGLSVALPYLLGLLKSEESDTWLQDRQTARADALVRSLIWENLQERNGKDLTLRDDLEEELLEYGFFPEEDFYLNGEGDPTFYLQPGFAEDSDRLITFTVSVEEILDEM